MLRSYGTRPHYYRSMGRTFDIPIAPIEMVSALAVYVRCPFCGKRHNHGILADDGKTVQVEGSRGSHCAGPGNGGTYYIAATECTPRYATNRRIINRFSDPCEGLSTTAKMDYLHHVGLHELSKYLMTLESGRKRRD